MSQVAGTVVELRDGQAVIACSAQPFDCPQCGAGRGCDWQSPPASRSLEVQVRQPIGALQPGDAVLLEVSDTGLLRAAARLYLPPLAGLLLAPALLRAAQPDTGILPLAAAVAGLLAGCLVARRWARQPPAIVLRSASPPHAAATRDGTG